MGNSSSSPSSSSSSTSPSKKRSRENDETEEDGHEVQQASSTLREHRKNMRHKRSMSSRKRMKSTSQGVTGRLLVKNCRVWTWLEDGLILRDSDTAGSAVGE